MNEKSNKSKTKVKAIISCIRGPRQCHCTKVYSRCKSSTLNTPLNGLYLLMVKFGSDPSGMLSAPSKQYSALCGAGILACSKYIKDQSQMIERVSWCWIWLLCGGEMWDHQGREGGRLAFTFQPKQKLNCESYYNLGFSQNPPTPDNWSSISLAGGDCKNCLDKFGLIAFTSRE